MNAQPGAEERAREQFEAFMKSFCHEAWMERDDNLYRSNATQRDYELWQAAYDRGRREGLEEAARIADEYFRDEVHGCDIADVIRQRISATPEGEKG